MISEYVLLCAPYRFESSFLHKFNEEIIRKELCSVVMPGVNMLTRPLLKVGLKNNYGIQDEQSLDQEIRALQEGAYRAVEDVQSIIDGLEDSPLKASMQGLKNMTKGKDLQAFDDCRIIDILSKAYAAKLTSKEHFLDLWEEQTKRIVSAYSSWEQYLASCVLGKMVQLVGDSWSITTKEEFVEDVYAYCITAVNAFSYSSFWKEHSLENLGLLLSKLLQVDYAKDKEEVLKNQSTSTYAHVKNLSADLVDEVATLSMGPEDLDLERYDYLSDLADYVLWNPIVEKELDWMFTPKNREQDALLMPKEFTGLETAKNYWMRYDDYTEFQDKNIFAMLFCTLSVKALLTEKALYHLDKKLFFKKNIVEIPWKEARFQTKLELDYGMHIKLNGKKVFDLIYAPDHTLTGLTDEELKRMEDENKEALEREWSAKLDAVLAEIPKRIQEFQAKK